MKKEIAFIIDVDGVMTDGMVSYPSMERRFSVRDGHGISMLDKTNIMPWLMSGECDESITERANKLRVPFDIGVKNKYRELIKHGGFGWYRLGHIAISDDVMDIELLETAIISFCPNDAEPEVIETVKNHPYGYILSRKGGQHCVREAIDILLKNKYLQNKFGVKVAEQTE